ncbi:MAG: CRISPR-associated CARF protein Csa3, partial [Thermofilaceae archaeon]
SALMDLRLRLQYLEEPLVVDLSGGMRIICALTLLALLISRKRFELYVESETGESGELYVPPGVIRAFTSLSREKLDILLEIAKNPGISVESLARRLGKPAKTVKNHLSELKSMGLVASHGRGAPLEVTRWGAVLVGFPERSGEKRGGVAV